ncbi:hypothetical protein QFC19_001057 [Naganishia cerealis]|uniref:Uncharacterized protein n=1 Tax=Naganishia cerealis TaxID=610337 RepID=A0ACC2WJ80_9TREE|nr:hypothetical protein QFC19_001057 [Naganishia cerealis]
MATPTPQPPPPAAPAAADSGLHAALRYTGVPPSVLKWRPRMPSKKMAVFLTLVGGGTYAYWYDRKECVRIKEEYVSRVGHLAKQPMEGSLAFGRKVTVYAAKWPEDDDYERGLKFFKRYVKRSMEEHPALFQLIMTLDGAQLLDQDLTCQTATLEDVNVKSQVPSDKPVLVSAAIDYDLVSSPQHGSLTRHLQAKIIKARRRALSKQLGLDATTPLEEPEPWFLAGTPGQLTPEQKEKREVEGGVVIIGRHTLKEYMEGLRRGWMCGVGKFDREKQVEALVSADGFFDLPEPLVEEAPIAAPVAEPEVPQAPATPQPQKPLGLGGLPLLNKPTPTAAPNAPAKPAIDPETLIPESAHAPPTTLPPQPTMLLLPWMNHLGVKQVPWMLWDMFNERSKYRAGGEAAMKLIFGGVRDFEGREMDVAIQHDSAAEGSVHAVTDLDFDIDVEEYYKKSFNDVPSRIQKLRDAYYASLRDRLQAARDLAAGVREPTKDEVAKPPLKEEELKAERLKKEIRWRNEEEGYEIVKKGTPVTWMDRWSGWLKVYTEPEDEL